MTEGAVVVERGSVLTGDSPDVVAQPTERKYQYPGLPNTCDGAEAVVHVEINVTQASGAFPITSSTTMGGGYNSAVTTTYLLNLEGHAVRTWKSAYPPGQSAYLLPNGNLLRAAMIPVQGGGTGGGEGGRIEQYDWEGNLVWEYDHATSDYQLHHDITPLPNGNVLALKVERKSLADCVAMGIDPSLLKDGYLLPDSVVEVEPVRPRGGRIVWEWHVWDHMVQSFDRTTRNYGDPRFHPQLVAPALSGGAQIPAFWNHMNSIAYNAALDQIVLSVRGNSELWVIDHGTTTAEASGHTGGRYGRGGDLLYRWGNPVTYAAGTSSNMTSGCWGQP